jgi:hypothetical protein
MLAVQIDHFWYDPDKKRLAINIQNGGTTVMLRLSRTEMRILHDSLCRGDDDLPEQQGDATIGWWDYSELDDDDAEPPLCLYRDDYFSVLVPHDVGQTVLDIIDQTLVETANDEGSS